MSTTEQPTLSRQMSIEDAPLTVRAQSALANAGVKTLGDILTLGPEGWRGLVRSKAIGPKTAKELEEIAARFANQSQPLRVELAESASRILAEAARLRRVADGRRGPAWRLLNGVISSIEAAGMALLGLSLRRRAAEGALGVPAFTKAEMAQHVDIDPMPQWAVPR